MIWSVFNFITFENKNCISEWRYQNISNRLIFDRNLLNLALNNNQLTTFTASRRNLKKQTRKNKNQMAVVLWIWITVVCIIAIVLMSSEAANGRELNRISFHWTQIDWFFFRYIIASLNTAFANSATAFRLQANLRIFILFLHFFSFILLFIATNDSDHFPLFAKQQDRKWRKKEKRNHYRNFYLKCYAVDTWLYLLDALALI